MLVATARLAGELVEELPAIGREHTAAIAGALKSFPNSPGIPEAGWRIFNYCCGVDHETERIWSDADPRPLETLHYLLGWERTDLPIVADQASAVRRVVELIARHPAVYQRGGVLTEVSGPKALPIEGPRLGTLVSEVAKITKGGKSAVLPAWLVNAVLAEPKYLKIPEIVGVVQSPVLRPDGSVVSRPGYDPATRLWYAPDSEFEEIPESPDKDDVRDAVDELLEPVSEVPLASPEDMAAYLAAVLTPMARPAIEGPVPLNLITANAPGTGKSLLVDLIAILTTGQTAPRATFPDSDTELGKVLTSLLLEGQRLVLFDNVPVTTTFGGANLEAALTGRTWRGRILGLSKTPELPIEVSWYATGNNLKVAGDTVRRCYVTRLHTDLEHPEDRSGFRHRDLLVHMREERPRFVRAALTVLRAHALAGRPGEGKPFGSFEAWSRVVRWAVEWSFGWDPIASRETLRSEDPEAETRLALLQAWQGLGSGSTVSEALERVKAGLAPALAETLDGRLNTKEVGKRLAAIENRVTAGLVLRGRPNRNKIKVWSVEQVT
jgi:hypothetical protein